jgi:hypothetical protein
MTITEIYATIEGNDLGAVKFYGESTKPYIKQTEVITSYWQEILIQDKIQII